MSNFARMKAQLCTWASVILMFFMSVGLSSCKHTDEPDVVITPVTRTVLVYMVANNSLGMYGHDADDLDEMLTAARSGGLHNGRLLVYHVPTSNQTPILKEVTADGIVNLLEYDTELTSVSSERMRQVIADTKALAPASDYGIVLWSHASGWLQTGIDEVLELSADEARPLDYGDDNGKKMRITTLAHVLDGQGFSFIYCDCCYMATVEVAYELRHATKYIVGSVTELPAPGMRYDKNIPLLLKDGDPDLIQCARNTYEHYASQLQSINRTCTMSVISTSALDDLATATRAIYGSGATISSSYKPQPFEITTSRNPECHYFDLANYVTAYDVPSTLQQQWNAVMDRAVLYKANTPHIWDDLEIKHHCGLSTYPLTDPSKAYICGYSELQWYRDVASVLVTK